MKKIIALLLITVLFISTAGAETLYPLLTVVVKYEKAEEQNTNVVTCIDRYGNLWSFYDDEDFWSVGDLCNLLMSRPDSLYEEDQIIDSSYEGKIF